MKAMGFYRMKCVRVSKDWEINSFVHFLPLVLVQFMPQ